MPFDPATLLAMPPLVSRHELTSRDTILYALGVGATELEFLYEARLIALPTMAVVMAYPGYIWRRPELGVDWQRLLHVGQTVEIHQPLPATARLRGETRFEAVYDKGADKGSLVRTVREIYMEDTGEHLATTVMTSLLRGDGGMGGSDGSPPPPYAIPDREPDAVVALETSINQAAIYRLSGDENPLHIDPEVARAAGFERPILHGLCTFGVVGRALLHELCNNDATRLRRMDVRFSSPVYPGETIVTEIWREGPGKAACRARVAGRKVIVIDNGHVEFA